MDVTNVFNSIGDISEQNKKQSGNLLANIAYDASAEGRQDIIGRGDELDKYIEHGLTPADWNLGNLDKELADRQNGWVKLGNGLAQAVVSEVGLGTAGAFADIFDFVASKILHVAEDDYQNPVSKQVEEWQDVFNNEIAPVYTDPTLNIQNGGLRDVGWWAKNIPNIASTLMLLLPAKGFSMVAGRLIRGSKLARGVGNARRWATGITKLDDASQMKRWQAAINSERGMNIANKAIETTGEALLMRTAENYQEARQTYVPVYEQATEELNNLTDAELKALVDKNPMFFDKNKVDVTNRDELAKYIARSSADRTFAMDFSNIIFDVIQLYGLRNMGKGIKEVSRNRAVRKMQQESIDAAGQIKPIASRAGATATGAAANTGANAASGAASGAASSASSAASTGVSLAKVGKYAKSVGGFLKDYGKYQGKTILSESTEAIEEAVNYIAQQEGLTYGKMLLAGQTDDYTKSSFFTAIPATWTNMHGDMKDYLRDPQLQESAFWGLMGGVIFGNVGSVGNKVQLAFERKAAAKQRKGNEKTGESTPLDRITQLFESNETRAVRTAMQHRLEQFNTLQEKMKLINDGYNPYSELDSAGKFKRFEGDIETHKAIARARVTSEFRSMLAVDAVNSGTYELLVDYFKSNEVKQAMINSGMTTKEEVDSFVQDTLNDMETAKDEYARQSAFVLNQVTFINNQHRSKKNRNADENIEDEDGYRTDIPVEYARLIAMDNYLRAREVKTIEQQLVELGVRENEQEAILAQLNPDINTATAKESVALYALLNAYRELSVQEKQINEKPANTSLDRLQKFNQLDQLKSQKEAILKQIKKKGIGGHVNSVGNIFIAINTGKTSKWNPETNKIEDLIQVTDAEIIKDVRSFFGEEIKDVSDESIVQAAKAVSSELNSVINNNEDGLAKLNPKLVEIYANSTGLETQKELQRSLISSTTDQIRNRVNYYHNVHNEVRLRQLSIATEVIRTAVEQYSGVVDENTKQDLIPAIVAAYNGNKTEARRIAEEVMANPGEGAITASEFMDALDILALHRESNKQLINWLGQVFDERGRQILQERTRTLNAENAADKNTISDQERANLTNTSKDEEEDDTDNLTAPQGQAAPIAPAPQPAPQPAPTIPQRTQPIAPTNLAINPTDNSADNRTKVGVKLVINNSGNIISAKTVSASQANTNNTTFLGRVNPDGTIEIDAINLPKNRVLSLVRAGLLTVDNDVDFLQEGQEWEVTSNPVIRKNSKRSPVTVVQQGIIEIPVGNLITVLPNGSLMVKEENGSSRVLPPGVTADRYRKNRKQFQSEESSNIEDITQSNSISDSGQSLPEERTEIDGATKGANSNQKDRTLIETDNETTKTGETSAPALAPAPTPAATTDTSTNTEQVNGTGNTKQGQTNDDSSEKGEKKITSIKELDRNDVIEITYANKPETVWRYDVLSTANNTITLQGKDRRIISVTQEQIDKIYKDGGTVTLVGQHALTIYHINGIKVGDTLLFAYRTNEDSFTCTVTSARPDGNFVATSPTLGEITITQQYIDSAINAGGGVIVTFRPASSEQTKNTKRETSNTSTPVEGNDGAASTTSTTSTTSTSGSSAASAIANIGSGAATNSAPAAPAPAPAAPTQTKSASTNPAKSIWDIGTSSTTAPAPASTSGAASTNNSPTGGVTYQEGETSNISNDVDMEVFGRIKLSDESIDFDTVAAQALEALDAKYPKIGKDILQLHVTNAINMAKVGHEQAKRLKSSTMKAAIDMGYNARLEDSNASAFSKPFEVAAERFLEEYNKLLITQTIDGKKVVRLEDIMRLTKQAFPMSKEESAAFYEVIKRYLLTNQTKYEIVDLDNDEHILERVDKTPQEVIEEEYGGDVRVDIRNFIESTEVNDNYFKVLDSLKIGDKVQLIRDGHKITVVANGQAIGTMIVPSVDGDAYLMPSKGFVIDVKTDANGNPVSEVMEVIKRLFLDKGANNDKLRELLTRVSVNPANITEDDVDEFSMNPVIAFLINQARARSNAGNKRTILKVDKKGNIDYKAVLTQLVRLWKYTNTSNIATRRQEIEDNIDIDISIFFKKLYRNYKLISSIQTGAEAIVSKKNGTRAVKVVEDDTFNSYDQLPLVQDAIADRENVRISVTTTGSTNNILISGRHAVTNVGFTNGSTFLTLFGSDGVPNFIKAYGVRFNDPAFMNTENQSRVILQRAFERLEKAMLDLLKPKLGFTSNSTDEIEKALKAIVAVTGSNNTIPLLRAINGWFEVEPVRMKDNSLTGIKLVYFAKGQAPSRFFIYNKTGWNKPFGYSMQDGVKNVPVTTSNKDRSNEEVVREALHQLEWFLFNKCNFNIDKNGVLADNLDNTEYDGFLNRKNGKLVLDIPDEVHPERAIHKEYDSYNDFLIDNNLIRVNTKKSADGTNFERFGENQRANSTLFISLPKPVEEISATGTTTTITTTTTTTTTDEGSTDGHSTAKNVVIEEGTKAENYDAFVDIFNDGDVSGEQVVDAIFVEDDRKRLEEATESEGLHILDLFPKTIGFIPNFNDYTSSDIRNQPIAATVGNRERAKVTVYKNGVKTSTTRRGANRTFVGPKFSNIAASTFKYRRYNALKLLMHERIHNILQSKSNKSVELLKELEAVYNEFVTVLEDDLKNNRLKPDEAIRLKAFLDIYKKEFAKHKELVSKGGSETFRHVEEFLVDSLTNSVLHEYLNSKESENAKDNGKPANLLTRIINAIAKFFGWTSPKDGTLFMKELNIIRDMFEDGNSTTEAAENTTTIESETSTTTTAPVSTTETEATETTEDNVTNKQTAEESKLEQRLRQALSPEEFEEWKRNRDNPTEETEETEEEDDDEVLFSSLEDVAVPVNTEVTTPYTSEMESIKSKAIADGTFMKAPNGKHTNLTERQWLQVRTKSFLNWFGDWINNPSEASKVVDENGEPLVVYHNTKNEFSIFKRGFSSEHMFHFGTIKSANDRAANGITLPVFLNIKTLKEWEDHVHEDKQDIIERLLEDGLITKEQFTQLRKKFGRFDLNRNDDTESEVQSIVEVLKENNVADFGISYINQLEGKGDTSYALFNSNQIKSATSNNGDFSTTNDDVYYSTLEDANTSANTNEFIFVGNVDAFADRLPIAQRARYKALVEQGTIQTKCY